MEGINPSIVLMENAAWKFIKNLDTDKIYYVIIAGRGNNVATGWQWPASYLLGKDDVYFALGPGVSLSRITWRFAGPWASMW